MSAVQTHAADDGNGKPDETPGGASGGNGTPVWPTVGEATTSLFTWFDTDDDEIITLDEIVGVLDPQGHHRDHLNAIVRRVVELIDTDDDGQLIGAEVSGAMTSLDSNEDGSLSPADLVPALAQQGLAPLLAVMLQGGPVPGSGQGEVEPPTPPGPPEPPGPPAGPKSTTVEQVVDVLLTRFDGDDDGAIALSELLAVLDPKGHRQKIAEALSALTDAVDTDGNGTMNQGELTAAVAMLDTDGNGTLDHYDHVPGPPADETAVDLIGILLPQLRQFDAGVLDAPV